ncbi:MAG: M56 family metallopeptidase [Bryobacteraceae bacterium]
MSSFFLVHLALAAALSLLAPAAIRLSERFRPQLAARLLLLLRLAPAGLSLLMVAGILAPSYLWLEPHAAIEPIGWVCLAAAALGVAVWSLSITRALRAVGRSLRHLRHCQRTARKTYVRGETAPVWLMEDPAPLVMLAGVLRSRLVISRRVVSALSAEQLAAVLRHERAHSHSRDNLKRLLVLLAPGIPPLFRGFSHLEQAWARVTEWAADDFAVAGDSHRSLALAAALVRVARLGAAPAPPVLVTSLMPNGVDLSARVDRLLHVVPTTAKPGRVAKLLSGGAGVLLGASVIALMAQPVTLHAAHECLEQLIR